jgi:DNA-damage-inducible protein D
MKKELIATLRKKFEDAAYYEGDVEYWVARDLQLLLGYDEWRNFEKVIDRAKESCENSGQSMFDHFVEVNKMVKIGSGTERQVEDIMLSRYACYLIAQNGDPKKDQIAFAQSYFALQTRKQELLEERIALTERLFAREKLTATETELSKTIYERGVDNEGFGRIRSRGDQALFGGYTTVQMKKKLGVSSNRPLADFLPTITIKAKDFAAEITNFNIKKKNMVGEHDITGEHIKNNRDVRGTLKKRGIAPEELPPEEDIKKLERKVSSSNKKMLKDKKRSLVKKHMLD